MNDARLEATVARIAEQVPLLTINEASRIVEAWLCATVAHQPCEGTGRVVTYSQDQSILSDQECEGPHVEIEVVDPDSYVPATWLAPSEIDGYVLYADPGRVRQPAISLAHPFMRLPLPDGWTCLEERARR